MRSEIWRDTDNRRAGMIPFVFEDGMGFERYVDYALDVPLYFVKRGETYHDVAGSSFRDLLAGKLAALPGERATMSDWVNHLGTLFPEVRVKRYLEMRGADCGSPAHILALPAFWVGLLYDEASLDAAYDMVKDWTAPERQALRDAVPKLALHAPFRGGIVNDLARQALALVARRAEAARAAAITTASTRRAISPRSKASSSASAPRPKPGSRPIASDGASRSTRSSARRRFEAHSEALPLAPFI